jgi:hypothetical protein
MTDDAKMYRERAAAERDVAAGTELPNVRDRALRSAARWDELAAQAERTKAGAEARQGRSAYSSSIARMTV